MKIRKADVTDAKGIAKVQVDGWRTTYAGIVPEDYLRNMSYGERELKWKEILKSNSQNFVGKTEDGQIVGFSSGGEERSGDSPGYTGELYAIYILKEFQRQGLGRKLVQPIVQFLLDQGMTSMLVVVLEENGSRGFYESLGAHEIDSLETEIGGKKLNELVYGWDDIRKI